MGTCAKCGAVKAPERDCSFVECVIARLEADRDMWKARAEKAEAERDELRARWAHPDALHPNGRCTCDQLPGARG